MDLSYTNLTAGSHGERRPRTELLGGVEKKKNVILNNNIQSRVRKSKSYAANLRDFVSAGLDDLLLRRSRGGDQVGDDTQRHSGGGGASNKPNTAKIEYEKNLRKGRILRATTYEEFCSASEELDGLEKADEWKQVDESEFYDYLLLRSRVKQFEDALQHGDIDHMLNLLRQSTTKSFAGLGHSSLYSTCRLGSKNLIDRYLTVVREVVAAVVLATESTTDQKSNEHILKALRQLRLKCGRTALLLSGGGTLGMAHIGVVKALYEADLLPTVVSGTSAGSIVAAVLCSRTDEELPSTLHDFCDGDLAVFVGPEEDAGRIARLKYFMTHHHLYDVANLRRVMSHWLGDMTFAEAYNRSKRILNIAVSTTNGSRGPLLLNMYSTPHVVIRSAVVASCSVPFLFQAAKLEYKSPTTGEINLFRDDENYIDGSLQGDIPAQDVSDQLGCDTFIVSQVNPHIRPWIREVTPDANLSERLYSTCSGYLWAEAAHYLDAMGGLIPRPQFLEDWYRVLEQRYIGDINILPIIDHQNVIGALRNPTPTSMKAHKLNGERATWNKINQIRYATAVENLLENAIRTITLRRQLNAAATKGAPLHIQIPNDDSAMMIEVQELRAAIVKQAHYANDPSAADWLAARLRRIFHKSSSVPNTPNTATTTPRKFFDSPATSPRARSPATTTASTATAPLDLIMTPTKTRGPELISSSPVSIYTHRRVQSDLTLHYAGKTGGEFSSQRSTLPCSTSSPRSTGRGRGRRRSRSRSRSRTPGRFDLRGSGSVVGD